MARAPTKIKTIKEPSKWWNTNLLIFRNLRANPKDFITISPYKWLYEKKQPGPISRWGLIQENLYHLPHLSSTRTPVPKLPKEPTIEG